MIGELTKSERQGALAILLALQNGETCHWKKQSAGFEQLYRNGEMAFAETVASVRAAADLARAADRANAERVASAQTAISERTAHDFETRLADARARADKLRSRDSGAAPGPGAGRAASVPGLPAAPGNAAETSAEDRLSNADALIATRLPPARKQYFFAKDVGHYGIFNGRKWRERIAPAVEKWIAANA